MESIRKIVRPPERPIVIFDGDCGFCRRWIRVWQDWTVGVVDYAPSRDSAIRSRFPEIPPEEFENSIQLIEPDGTVYSGAEAVFRAIAKSPGKRLPLWIYEHNPPFAWIAERSYAFVAAHRIPFSVLTKFILPEEPSRFFLIRSIYLRLLGLVYLLAFGSLGMQIKGLIGSDGILPVAPWLQVAGQQLGPIERFHVLPTFSWFNSGDAALQVQCGLGILFALLLVVGFLPLFSLICLWLLYLSLATIGRDFLGFQWDNLLLEAGLLAIFLAPFSRSLSRGGQPSLIAIWLQRWLLFRLMFFSGVVKLTSGDPTWSNFTALDYHYETQPLPTWIGYYAHQSPEWMHHASVRAMFFIEMAVSLLILGPRWLRVWAFWPMVILQVAIALTGNYCFFNLISAALCLWILDDGYLGKRFFPKAFAKSQRSRGPKHTSAAFACFNRIRAVCFAAVLLVILIVSSIHLLLLTRARPRLPKSIVALYSWVQPFRGINSYGLFSVMTTERLEIIIEGSNDGKTWWPYEFKYKPGKLNKKPGFVEPLQPRLDWQMWFAALGDYQQNQWFISLAFRLLEGSRDVLALFDTNPFPDKPPARIRALLYQYRFTDLDTKRRTGDWWRRTYQGIYLPEISLNSASGADGNSISAGSARENTDHAK